MEVVFAGVVGSAVADSVALGRSPIERNDLDVRGPQPSESN